MKRFSPRLAFAAAVLIPCVSAGAQPARPVARAAARPAAIAPLAAPFDTGALSAIKWREIGPFRGGRSAAVEVLLNTKLVAELIDKGDISAIKEAVEKSLAEGSQTFEQDIARLITEGTVDKKEGMAHADSPTNLQWRLQNDFGVKDAVGNDGQDEIDDMPSFTEITLDVKH